MSTSVTEVDVYARISLDTRDGESVDNQLSALRRYASEHGLSIVDTYRDDGISATSDKRRPAFEDVLARGKGARPLLVFNTDRFVRVSADLERVLDLGITVLSMTTSNLDLSTAGGKAVARTITAWSTYEGDVRKERLTLAYSERTSRGIPIWKEAPFGHTRTGELVAEQADLIRDAAQRVIDGHSLYSIAKDWTYSGVKTRRGGDWTTQSLRDLLLHPRMRGVLLYKGEPMPESQVVPVLDAETNAALRAVLLNPARRTSKGGRVTTLLASIAHCGICNERQLHASTYRKAPGYRCQSDNHGSYVREPLDNYVIDQTVLALTAPDAAERLLSASEDKSGTLARLEAVRASLSEWEAVASEIGPAEYLRVTKPLRAEADALSAELTSTDRAEVFSDFVQRAKDGHWTVLHKRAEAVSVWESLPLLRQRRIIDELWTVTVDRSGVELTPK